MDRDGEATRPRSASVVIPARNAAATLGDQLKALAPEIHLLNEVIVSDNGSTDDTATIARRFGATVVDSSATPGPGAARNTGAAHATGNLLIFLDADDLVDVGYVAAMLAAAPDAELLGARVDQHLLNPGWPGAARTIAQGDALPTLEPGRPWIYGATLAIDRAAFEALGGFDVGLRGGEDVDLSVRAHQQGLRFAFVPRATVHCRLRHDLGGVFRQGISYGRGGAQLDRKYRRIGAPYASLVTDRAAFPRLLAASFVHLVRARGRADRAHALFIVGRRIGYLVEWSSRPERARR